MSKELIEFDVFDGGLNTKSEQINLVPGQSPAMDNILFGDYGSIKTRGGISTHNSVAMSTDGPQGFASYRPSTMSAQMMVIASGSLFVLTGASTTPVAISGATGVWDPYFPVEMEQMNEKMFIAYPDAYVRKFNGTNLTLAGVLPPSQVLTAACDAAGTMTGAYRYVYWGVNSYAAEGDYVVTPSTVKTIASGNVRVNNIPTAPASQGINTWKIGRNTAGASGIYWLVTSVTNGVTSFTDTAGDDELETLAPTDQGYPRFFENMCVYGGRLWGSVGDILWYSNVNQPEEFPSTNFIRVGNGTGSFISSITPFMGMIVVSMSGFDPTRNGTTTLGPTYSAKTALYVLRIGDSIGFNDPENWYLNLIAEDIGSESQRACIPVAGYLWLTSRDGVSLFDGSGLAQSVQDTSVGGVPSLKISDQVGSWFDLAYDSDIRIAAAIQWNDRVYLSIAKTRSGSAPGNNMTLVYDTMRVGRSDPKKGAWSTFSDVSAGKFVVHEGQLYGSGPVVNGSDTANNSLNGGYIFKWDNGNTYDNVTASTRSPIYYMAPIRGKKNHVYNEKDFRYFKVWTSGVGILRVSFVLNGKTYSDGTAVHTEQITLSATGSETTVTLPAGVSGKHIWVRFTMIPNGANSLLDLNISRVHVFYNLRGLRNT